MTTPTLKLTFDVSMDLSTTTQPASDMTEESSNDLTDDRSEDVLNNDRFLFETSLTSRNLSLEFKCKNVPTAFHHVDNMASKNTMSVENESATLGADAATQCSNNNKDGPAISSVPN